MSSGVAYITSHTKSFDDIVIVNLWPGESATSQKTPTRIAYASENSNFKSCGNDVANNRWGFEVQTHHKSYSWTKLLLDQKTKPTAYDDPALASIKKYGFMQLPKDKDALAVCEDFLREVYTYVSGKIIKEISKETFDITPMECWITLPASKITLPTCYSCIIV
jgi:hypothetical protein